MASEVIQAISVLAPLIEKVAGYLADEHDDLPDVPGVSALDIELERAKVRSKKRSKPPV